MNGPGQDLDTPLKAVADGEIVFAGNTNKWYGIMLVLKVKTTYGIRYARYCHLNRLQGRTGHVKQGDVLCYIGTTGNSTGPHLHFDVLKKEPGDWLRYARSKAELDEYFLDPALFFKEQMEVTTMQPDFKLAFLKMAKEVYGDEYNENWNPDEKNAFIAKILIKSADYKRRAETPVTVVDEKYKNKIINFSKAFEELLNV